MQNHHGNPDKTTRVCAIIVTYHPSPALLQNAEAVRQQVSELVVVDNGSDEDSAKLLVAMTSGSLIKTRALIENGLYDEAMFIDYVDFDLCLRLRRRGFKLIRAGRAFLLHCLGTLEAHSFFGFPLALTSHNATRCYYIMRNRVAIYRRYGLLFPFWAFNDFIWLLIDFTKIILFEQDKRAKLGNALRGIRHGLAGLSGPMASAAV
ncbi:MAG TPA: hypothetical protein VG754_01245 [Verrucomicrobiae bacterium]|nr:hypothetical protein [Verrucomicrobiae bacterium]